MRFSEGKMEAEIVKGGDMSRNTKKGMVSLLGGAGFIALLIGLFTGVYSFWIGVIVAFSFWIVTGAVSTMIGTKEQE
jgi:hypothetical protein